MNGWLGWTSAPDSPATGRKVSANLRSGDAGEGGASLVTQYVNELLPDRLYSFEDPTHYKLVLEDIMFRIHTITHDGT